MAILFGNTGNNTSIVTNGDGYDEYRGLTGDDIYNVNTALTDEVTISDSDGINTVVLGNAEIASTRFFDGGAQFTYASGGVLTVLGDMTNMNFVFGGGTDPFDPTAGGTSNDFDTTVTAFGVDPATLDLTPVEGEGGTINDDGTVGGEGQPTYALAADQDSVDEGGDATFTLTTTNVEEGTEVAYTISGVSAADVDGALTGTVEVGADGTATITVSIVADETTEGEETLTVTAGDQEASTVINDTSLTPAAFPLAEAMADLQDAQADRVAFLNDNADNELLEDTAVIAGLDEDEEPTADEVATAIAQADAAAEDDVIDAENDVLDANAALARARAATFNAYATDANADDDFGADDNGDVTQADVEALYALDAIADDGTTRMSDVNLNAAEAEAQADVDAATVVYNADGASATADGTVFDLYNEADVDEYVDLSGMDAEDMGNLTINLADFNVDTNNKDDNGGGGNDTIILPDLADYAGDLTINNMILGDTANKGFDTLVAPGLANAIADVAVAVDGDYLDFTLTTDANGVVFFEQLIKAETLAQDLVDAEEIDANNAGAFGVTLNEDGDTVEELVVGTFADALSEGDNELDGDEFVQLLQGYTNLVNTATTSGLEQASFTAADLQDAIADAEADVAAFEAAEGDNETILTELRDAIADYAQAGGALATADTIAIDENTTLGELLDAINGVLNTEDETDRADAIDGLVDAFDAEGADATLLEGEETLADLDANERPVEQALGAVVDRAELDNAVDAAEAAFGDTATGGILNTLVALQEERQDQIDALADAEDALDEAEAAAEDIQVLVDELESLDTAIDEAEDVLDDEGYTVESIDAANEAGTADNDIFLLGDTDSAIANFELTEADTGDTIFVGEAFAVVNAGEDEDITDDLGDVATLEAIVVDDGADTTIYFEEKAFAGNGSTDADTIEITLTGVTDAEVSIDADGFLTVA
jgi:hypothetical protein